MAVCDTCGHKDMCGKYLSTGGVKHCDNHTGLKRKPTKAKRQEALSTLNRAIGIIEGVAMTADQNASEALGTAVEMLEEALKVVLTDG